MRVSAANYDFFPVNYDFFPVNYDFFPVNYDYKLKELFSGVK